MAQTGTVGTYGTFSDRCERRLELHGKSPMTSCRRHQVYTDTFTVRRPDGTATSVTVNITGTNDAAGLVGRDRAT